MKTTEKIESITIIGRKWWDRVNGNTYHTAEILVNGESLHKTGMTYGYDDHYIQTAAAWLKSNGYIHGDKIYPLSLYCRDNGIAYYATANYGRKRDL